MSSAMSMRGGIRELSLDELDVVSGAVKFTFGPITVAIKEEGVTGISIGPVGVGVVDGSLCGYIGPFGGCL